MNNTNQDKRMLDTLLTFAGALLFPPSHQLNIGSPPPPAEEDFPPIATPEEAAAIKQLYDNNPQLKSIPAEKFDPNEAWMQTWSGKRFTPCKPVVDDICIEDIAHALSNLCRFSGHGEFYSVAQHSVLVSYVCDTNDQLYGLLHDGTEAFLMDLVSPLKRSGKFDTYIEFETNLMKAICQRFNLPEQEPPSVKKADKMLLATEARDVLPFIRSDWNCGFEPLPFKIEPWEPKKAEQIFLERFVGLTSVSNNIAASK